MTTYYGINFKNSKCVKKILGYALLILKPNCKNRYYFFRSSFHKNNAPIVKGLSKWAYAAATATAVVFEASTQSRRKIKNM